MWPGQPVLGLSVHKFAISGVPEGWKVLSHGTGASAFTYWRFRGYLRPQPHSYPVPAHEVQVEDAAFEVVCDTNFDPSLPTMIAITTPQVNFGSAPYEGQGRTPDIGLYFAYEGFQRDDGLPGPASTQPPYAEVDLLFYNRVRAGHEAYVFPPPALPQPQPRTHNLVCARIVTRTLLRPAIFQMQRNVELVRTVRQMLLNGNASWRPGDAQHPDWLSFVPPGNLDAIIFGGSFGGGMSQWCLLMFPEDFQGAVSSGAPMSVRRFFGRQEAQRYIMALSGFGECGNHTNELDILHISGMFWQAAQMRGATANWSPFYHGSLLTAWRDGFLKRPILCITNDEDIYADTTDSNSVLDGQREFTKTGVTPTTTPARPPIFWSRGEKRCHEWWIDLESPFNDNVYNWWYDLILDYIGQLAAITPAGVNPVFTPPTTPANATEDPYDHAFMPPPILTVQPPATPPALRLDVTFTGTGPGALASTVPAGARRPGKSFGCGTYLGFEDSFIAGVPYGSTSGAGAQEILVGSADGVVTRFALDPVKGELVPQAMSESLGYGAWGMVVGEADGQPGKEIIVATHRGLHVLDRNDHSVMASNRNLPWEFSAPRRLAVADVVAGGTAEVVMACERGVLAVFASNNLSQPLATYSEPGVVDLAVLNNVGNPADIVILSHRGHLAKVRLDASTSPPSFTLVGLSARLNGIPIDMELADADPAHPGLELVVLMASTVLAHKEHIWVIDPATLQPIGNSSFASTVLAVGGLNASGGAGLDLEVYNDGNQVFFIVLVHDRLVLVTPGALGTGTPVELCAYQPMMRALDVLVGNIDESPEPEILLSTEAGYVCWLTLADLQAASPATAAGGKMLPFQTPGGRKHGVPNGVPANCSRTLAATWGMTAVTTTTPRTLEVIDQSGTRWSVDSSGNATVLHEVGFPRESDPFALAHEQLPLAGPFRSIVRTGVWALGGGSFPSWGVFGSADFLNNPSLFPGLPVSNTHDIRTYPYTMLDAPNGLAALGLGPGSDGKLWAPNPSNLQCYNGCIVFARGGDMLDVGTTRYLAWWSSPEHYTGSHWGNRVQGITLDNLNNNPTAGSFWWSTAAPSGTLPGPFPLNLLATQAHMQGSHELRNYHGQSFADANTQALKLFTDPVDSSKVRCALTTPGARLIVLEPGNGPTNVGKKLELDSLQPNKALDFGSWGTALAVGPVRGGARTLYVGAMAYFADDTNFNVVPQTAGTPADDMVSIIAAVHWHGDSVWTNCSLVRSSELVMDGGTPARPKVFGVCGMAVGDIIPNGAGNVELVVGSLDGHLLVYALDATTGDIGSKLHESRVEGSVGAYNSIVIADLDQDGQNELYVAGSLGLRKWVFQ